MGSKYWAYGLIVAIVAGVYLLYRLFKRRDRVQTVALSDWVADRRPPGDAPSSAPAALPHTQPSLDSDRDWQDPIDETAPAVLGPPEWRKPPP